LVFAHHGIVVGGHGVGGRACRPRSAQDDSREQADPDNGCSNAIFMHKGILA